MKCHDQHARQFLQRSKKRQHDANAAADFAAMENVLKKRQERPFKKEKQKSETPRPTSNGLGTSMSDPLVIDD